ncbi:cell division protein FtsB [Coxiella endosymbiont of Rhipicephalus microplus]|uniref:cell division protein FtsB n=1 Tax=Coxiella endosymbiont of Rhipicephalus microplus TaxID=1656186 RepID=UPI000C7FF5DC|nr:cell division protein FtsB [Coxiella endosymbiont of Rhipicephalus microplus]PMB54598.1 Cell division protein DivIC (FtsB), stabilizes FtsL against RasP cleavage [Coxiella-like endosymbiont]
MRSVVLILVTFFFLLQYKLWFSAGGILSAYHLHENLNCQMAVNKKLAERNAILMADIFDLKHGNEAIEEHARNDLGMIKKGEVFYQITNLSQ